MKRVISWIVCTGLLYGCATSTITGFRDPDFPSKSFNSIVVFAHGMALEAAALVENQICDKITPTGCHSGESVLPPTRQYTPEEVKKYLTNSGADGVLIVALVGDRSETRYFGTVSNSTAFGNFSHSGSVNFYGNNALWGGRSVGTIASQTISTPIYGHSRTALGQLGLFDLGSGSIVWIGEISVKGKGLLNITDKAFIGSATTEIAQKLREYRLIR